MSQNAWPSHRTMAGYVTIVGAILNKSPGQIEETLGYQAGSLDQGYAVYQLAEEVLLGDFDWKDKTAYSDGWHYDSYIGEYVQRQDELRAHLGKQLGYDEARVDHKTRDIMRREQDKLNIRTGPRRIVKLLPAGHVGGYPDSSFKNTPQWRLKPPGKNFTLFTAKGPGQTVMG